MMYDSKISSNFLYHFTKSSDVIINILKNGFYPRAAQEDVSFMMPNYPKIIVAIPMVCFTDIPLENADVHRAEYGRYGLGLKKEWGIRTGLNPVGYILKESEADKAFNQMQKVVIDNAIQLDKDNIENE